MGPPHSFITSPLTASTRAINLFVLLLCTLLLLPSAVNGAITNTTIDDADSSHFTFTGGWTAVSPSSPCDFCSSKPDASQTFGGTWHDGNYRTGASETTTGSFTFTGSAVYIFGIDQAQSQPDIAFTLGSTQSVHHYTGTEQFVYNALFFSATGLAADQQHTVNWIFNIDQTTGVGVQAALFDYAIVTSGTEDLAPAPNPQTIPPTTTATTTQTPQSKTPNSTTQSPSSPSSSSKSIPNGQQLAGDQSSSSGTAIASQPKASSSTSTAPSANSSLSPGVSSGAITSPAPDPAPAPDPDPNPESATSAPHHPSNLGAILGAVLGALALAVLALVVFLLCRHRRRLRAREDDERRAAGLPPAPPGMRRVRGRPVLQPYFVEERPPAPDVAGNVFVTGAFATASSASAGAGTGTGTGTGTLLAATDAAPAFTDTGTGAPLGRYPAEKTQDMGYTNPHAQVSRQPSQSTSMISDVPRLGLGLGLDTGTRVGAPSDKRGEAQVESAVSPSTVLSPSSALSPSSILSPSSALSPSPSDAQTTSARERYLEQRLATLEAHVAAYLPPPYEQPEP